ncbi:hypothetical protein [Bradyrhizobium sp. CCBAU 51745]|uniref:hypothetical protein n=1 Tax=Bradyrhizobium sp. CCBAU 51745 TaxID=1325099 RepID=UPI0023055B1E|nr:hypothetical protein [Bradyrhizobium sp. CCBAU 51745]
MLVFDNELHELHTTRRWRDLARMPRADFEAQVEAFLKPGGTLSARGRWRARPNESTDFGRTTARIKSGNRVTLIPESSHSFGVRTTSEGWWARQDSNLQPDRYERRTVDHLR